MEQQSNEAMIDCMDRVYDTVLMQESTGETVVPDKLPDIDMLLDTQTDVTIRSRSLLNGRITLEGEIHAVLLYLGGDPPRPQKLVLDLPLNIMAEDERLVDAKSFTASVSLASADARLINSRKAALRAETAVSITAYKDHCLDLTTHSNDPDSLESLHRQKTFGYVVCVAEKDFIVSEDIRLRGDDELAEDLLFKTLNLSVGETKLVGSKMILQGNAQLDLLYVTPQEELHAGQFEIPFSQIMDVPDGISASAAALSPSEIYVELLPGLNGSSEISVEIHLHASVVCTGACEVDYMADAYCLHHPCRIDTQTALTMTPFRSLTLREAVRESVTLPEIATELIGFTATAGLPVVVEGGLRLPVELHALYFAEDGRPSAVSKRISVEFRMDDEEQGIMLLSLPAINDVSAVITNEGLEFRLNAEQTISCSRQTPVTYVSEAAVDTEQEIGLYDGPSAVVVRPGDRSAWALAKQYGSTQQLIETANPDGLTNGAMVLIPRAR